MLASEWGVSPLLVKLLINRGVEADSFSSYLFPSFDHLYEPYRMKGMQEAVERILLAITRKEKLLVWGDFDVDGVTATTLLVKFMRDLKFPSYYYIPHRQNEGYGLNKEGIKKAFAKNIKLIISCDCGTSSLEEIQFAHSLGMEVIVTDHHQVETPLPPNFIIVNPCNPGCDYPFKELSGVGVAFKLCQAISQRINFPLEKLKSYLDLVAIGTLADMVPLNGENRTFVKLGLENLSRRETSPGLKALIDVAGLSTQPIEQKEIGYIIAPRLNACGRLSLAKTAVKLLLTDSNKEAFALAQHLHKENFRRQNIEKKMCKEADNILSGELKQVLFAANKDWHPGVIGLVASFLREKYNRPALAFAIDNDTARGSARSIPGFSIFEALKKCSHLISNFGGHQMAAGLTLSTSNIEKLEEELNFIAENLLSPENFVSVKLFDAELNLEVFDDELVQMLKILSPFGAGNPKPLFLARGVKVISWRNIKKGKKLIVKGCMGGKEFEALSFNSFNGEEEKIISSGELVDMLYFPKLNTWRGAQNIQLDIKDLRGSGGLHDF